MLSNILSYPWYKPASLLYTIVLHECISVPDLESPGGGGGGISTCIWGAVDRGGHVYIYMHACYEDLHFFFDNIIWGDIPFPTY